MQKQLIRFCVCMVLISGMTSCRSKKACADFDDPKRSHKVDYSKSGLVKKKGYKTKPAWNNN